MINCIFFVLYIFFLHISTYFYIWADCGFVSSLSGEGDVVISWLNSNTADIISLNKHNILNRCLIFLKIVCQRNPWKENALAHLGLRLNIVQIRYEFLMYFLFLIFDIPYSLWNNIAIISVSVKKYNSTFSIQKGTNYFFYFSWFVLKLFSRAH